MSLLNIFRDDQLQVPDSPHDVRGSDRAEHLYLGMKHLGAATYWQFDLNNRDYRNLIQYITGVGSSSYSRLDKQALHGLCEHLDIAFDQRSTTRNMRNAISKRLSLGYDTPTSRIRPFNKDELQQITAYLLRTDG